MCDSIIFNSTDIRFICCDCIGDEFLVKKLKKMKKRGKCEYCAGSKIGIKLTEITHQICEILYNHYEITYESFGGSGGQQAGRPLLELIGEILELENEIPARDIQGLLAKHGDNEQELHRSGDLPQFDEDSRYISREGDSANSRDFWNIFCQQIKHRSRFYNKEASSNLDNIFGNLDAYSSGSNPCEQESVIRKLSSSNSEHLIFRARIAYSASELKDILISPVSHLGAVPAKLATAGRMNAAGIPVFYGALEAETCIAEIRAPVGSSVVIGEFKFVEEVNLLDLDLLADTYIIGSPFDDKYIENRNRSSFFKHLVHELTQPVMPNDEVLNYIPTQVISEYLAEKKKLDGILFSSSQTGGQGKNIVLFNHASKVKANNLKGGLEREVKICKRSGLITINNAPLLEKEEKNNPQKCIEDIQKNDDEGTVRLPPKKPCLELNEESIAVKKINAISYDFIESSIRTKKEIKWK